MKTNDPLFVNTLTGGSMAAIAVNDLIQTSEIKNLPPRELVVGLFLFATSALMSTHPDLTDEDRRKLSAKGCLTELSLNAMEEILSKLDLKIKVLRSERN